MRSLAVVALLAGCLSSAPPAAETEHRLGGAYTAEATSADVAALAAIVEAEGGRAATMESFPMQFAATGLDADACTRVRTMLEAQAYVASLGPCTPVTASDGPDTGGSSG